MNLTIKQRASGRSLFNLTLLLGCALFAQADDLYFPNADSRWESVDPNQVGWDQKLLEEVMIFAQQQRSSDAVVLLDGRVLAEGVWQVEAPTNSNGPWMYPRLLIGHSEDDRPIEDVASVQKSIVSVLAGIARGKGLLDFDQSVDHYLGQGWSTVEADSESKITIRHLLTMTTGLGTQSVYEAEAGERWVYSTVVYRNLMEILQSVSGLTARELSAQWLTSKIGMNNSDWDVRVGFGRPGTKGPLAFQTTAPDLARFGLLILAEGKWAGEDILSDPNYLDEAFDSKDSINESYGLIWQLNSGATHISNGQNPQLVEGPYIPSAPADLVMASGGLDRKVYIVPSLGLVVARIGDQPEGDFDEELWRRIMAAAP